MRWLQPKSKLHRQDALLLLLNHFEREVSEFIYRVFHHYLIGHAQDGNGSAAHGRDIVIPPPAIKHDILHHEMIQVNARPQALAPAADEKRMNEPARLLLR